MAVEWEIQMSIHGSFLLLSSANAADGSIKIFIFRTLLV
jgi:hypothetical protein